MHLHSENIHREKVSASEWNTWLLSIRHEINCTKRAKFAQNERFCDIAVGQYLSHSSRHTQICPSDYAFISSEFVITYIHAQHSCVLREHIYDLSPWPFDFIFKFTKFFYFYLELSWLVCIFAASERKFWLRRWVRGVRPYRPCSILEVTYSGGFYF